MPTTVPLPSERWELPVASPLIGTPNNAQSWALANSGCVLSTQTRVVDDFGCQLCAVADTANAAWFGFGAGLHRDFIGRADEPVRSQLEHEYPSDCHGAPSLAGSPALRSSPASEPGFPPPVRGLQNILHNYCPSTPNVHEFRYQLRIGHEITSG
jgi:hypothetical protein